jgi:hypothetical protein
MNIEKKNDKAHKIIFIYKYDERFSIYKRKLHTAIKNYYEKQGKVGAELEKLISSTNDILDSFFTPYPLSRALADFSYCIEKLARRDNFLFVIHPEKFRMDTKGWTPQKFMIDYVIPRARIYLDEFNKKLVKELPFLKYHQKRTLDANYYIFQFTRDNFSYHASQDAIPNAIRNFLIKDILDSENASEVVASQLVYLKQIINNISISGLLFTEDNIVQEKVLAFESKLIQKLKKDGVLIGNIYEIKSLGNQKEKFLYIFHEFYHGIKLKRKYGKKYDETEYLVSKIISNANELISIFNALQSQ